MKVLIVDEQWLARFALRNLLSEIDPQTEIVLASDFSESLDLATEHPDIALIVAEPSCPGINSIEDFRLLITRLAETPLILFSHFNGRQDMLRALEIGAAGLLSKNASESEIRKALETVVAGEVYLPRSILKDTAEPNHRSSPFMDEYGDTMGSIANLTDRQRQVLAYLARGMSNMRIATEMGLSENTVRIHISAILRTLRLDNRTQAALLAAEYQRGDKHL